MPSDIDLEAEVMLKFKNLNELQNQINKMFGNIKLGDTGIGTSGKTQDTNTDIKKLNKNIQNAGIKLKRFYMVNNLASLSVEKHNMRLKKQLKAELKQTTTQEDIIKLQEKYSAQLKKAKVVGEQYIQAFRNKQSLMAKRGITAEEQQERWKISLEDIAEQQKGKLGEREAKVLLNDVLKDIKWMTREFKDEIKNIPTGKELEILQKSSKYISPTDTGAKFNEVLLGFESGINNLPDYEGKELFKKEAISKIQERIKESQYTLEKAKISGVTSKGNSLTNMLSSIGSGKFRKFTSRAGAALVAIELGIKIITSIMNKVINNQFSGYIQATTKLWNTTIDLALKPISDKIGMFLLPIMIKLLKYVTSPLWVDNITNLLSSTLQYLSGLVTLDFGKMFKSMYGEKGIVESLFGMAGKGDLYKSIRTKVIDPIIDVGEKLHGALIGIWEFGLGIKSAEKLTQIKDAIWNALIWIKDKTVDGLLWVANDAKTIANGIMESLMIMGAYFVDAITNKDTIYSIVTTLMKGLVLIPNTIIDGLSKLSSYISDIIKPLRDGLALLMNSILDWIGNIAEKLLGKDIGSIVKSKIEGMKISNNFLEDFMGDPSQVFDDLKISADDVDKTFNYLKGSITSWSMELRKSGESLQKYNSTISNSLSSVQKYNSTTSKSSSSVKEQALASGFGSEHGWANYERAIAEGKIIPAEGNRAVGGIIPHDGRYYLHAGEMVYNRNQSTQMLNGTSKIEYNIKIDAKGFTAIDNNMANSIGNQVYANMQRDGFLRSGGRLNG